jgi:hypothetical protein
MFATTTTVPVAIVYLMLVFLHGYGDGSPITADVLQDGVPAYRVSASREHDEDGRIYRVDATVLDESADSTVIVRVEQSDLVGHTYLLHASDGASPSIVSIAGALEQLGTVSRSNEHTLDLPSAGDDTPGGGDPGIGSTIHVVRRPGFTVMSAPESGIVAFVREEQAIR